MELTYDLWIAALCLWREARGTTIAALRAIWWVIQNRVSDAQSRWPKTIPGVILQNLQFSSFTAGDPNAARFPIEPIPPALATPDWSAFLNCQAVVSSESPDPTNGANAYESLPPDAQKPEWADPEKITVTIGTIRFYKL